VHRSAGSEVLRGRGSGPYGSGRLRLRDYLPDWLDERRGPIFVDGTIELLRTWNLGGDAGNVTLAVAGDLIIDKKLALTNRHDPTARAIHRCGFVAVREQAEGSVFDRNRRAD